MGLITWIIAGLVAAALAGVLGSSSGYGTVVDIILGVLGALIGGYLTVALFGAPGAINTVDMTSIIIAFIAGAVVIAMVRLFGHPARV